MKSTWPSSNAPALLACVPAPTTLALTLYYIRPVHAGRDGGAAAARAVEADFSELPISFEKNEGQAPPEVRFIGRGLGHTTYLTGGEAVLVFAKPSAKGVHPLRERGRLAEAVDESATLGTISFAPGQ